jgi:RNA polymerase sigma-70 factor (sigma-E family)
VQYEQFVRERQRALFRFAVVLCGDPVLAEEILQDVLGHAYERWHLVAAAEDANAYVRRMLVNEYLGWRRRRRRLVPVGRFAEDALPNTPDHADAHVDRVDLQDRLTALPPKQRAALVLRYYAGLSFADVAAHLGCRESSARSYVTRALATLRIQLSAPQPVLDKES